ncbi:MAG: cell division protein FtsZ [Bacteroidales bacterium]|nr:cell division protein FtsZ [Bacteroidales bacterium]
MNNDELMPFHIETTDNTKNSIIKVIGVGGGGGNAVNNMYEQGIENVDFIICNTDKQVLDASPIPTKIQLGYTLTEGLGAGNDPNQGREAAKESIQEIMQILQSTTKMVFIAAGMGGGTGTGAAPIVAQVAKELKILTVGIVTIPFLFEGERRVRQAIEGLNELKQHVDSMIVINNEKLIDVYGELEITEAFKKADEIITVAAKGIAEIITKPGTVNVDFADVKSVMKDSGVAVMGTGFGEGDKRAIKAVKNAITSPLLNNNDIKGAKNLLVNIISPNGNKISTNEIKEINDYLQGEAGFKANLIWGMTIDESLDEDKASVTVVATQFDDNIIPTIEDILGGKSSRYNKKEKDDDKENNSEPEKKRKTEEEISEKIKNIENHKFDYTDENVVNDLEKTPAYKRQQLLIDFSTNNYKNTTRFKLNNDNTNNFLNPMVD